MPSSKFRRKAAKAIAASPLLAKIAKAKLIALQKAKLSKPKQPIAELVKELENG